MKTVQTWTIEALREHLQYAVDLEFWTIPLYLSAAYSIKDPSSDAYQYLMSVANQEMLHVELASNVANAYGCDLDFATPVYEGTTIPHLDFSLDWPNPTVEYCPHSAEIGPADLLRLNTMCLIEYPEWGSKAPSPDVSDTEYGSIGEFYDAVTVGATQLAADIVGNRNQVDVFSPFYRNFKQPTVTLNGEAGLPQVANIVTAICAQGEGRSQDWSTIPKEFQNTADDIQPSWPHFWKFKAIRDGGLPQTYTGQVNPAAGSPGARAQAVLVDNFQLFLETVEAKFTGGNPANFSTLMAGLGNSILNCWKNNAVPKFGPAPAPASALKAAAKIRRQFPARP